VYCRGWTDFRLRVQRDHGGTKKLRPDKPSDACGWRQGRARRSDRLEKRPKLREAWAAYCEQAIVVSNVDGQAAAQWEANAGADSTTRRYAVPG
jgi:hypothetical protein